MKVAPGDDLEPIDLAEPAPPAPRAPQAPAGWLFPVLAACAVVATASLVAVAVMEWRQTALARRSNCLTESYAVAELRAPLGNDPGGGHRQQLARCLGLEGNVPDVVGLSLSEAERRLREAGFDAQVEAGDSSRRDAVVVAQEPGGDTEVPLASVVGLRTRR